MRFLLSLFVLLVLAAGCQRGKKERADAGAAAEAPGAGAKVRRDAGAGVLDLDAYLVFQRARMDALTKKLPAQAARAAGLEASGLPDAELKQIDRVVTDVLVAVEQARSLPEVATLPDLEKDLAAATPEEKVELEARIQEGRKRETEATAQALEPVRKKHGDAKVEQVLARLNDLEQVMYFKANALVPVRE